MARRRSYSRRSAARRRRLFWARDTNAATLSDTNQANWRDLLDNYEGGDNDDVEGVTITRIRGTVYWVPPATTTQEYHWLTVGIMVSNTSDMVQLTDAQQLLRSEDPYRDWMFYKRFRFSTATADIGGFEVTGWPTHYELDLKSQRRFDERSESLFATVSVDPLGDGNEALVYSDLHVLCKRP